MSYHVYGIGAALVDTEIEVTDNDLNNFDVEKGVMTLVDEARQHQLIDQLKGHLVAANRASGGSAANSIIAAQYFGSKTFYSCKVADDENGHFYLKDLSTAGVEYPTSSLHPQGITGKCLVMITPDAERTMNTFLGISETLSPEQIDVDALKKSNYAYIEGYLVTSPTGKQAAIELRKHAQSHNVKTAVSLSDPGIVEFFHEGLQEIIGATVDLLFCNEAEALQFTKTESIEQAAENLKEIAKTFAITLGAKGSLVYDGKELLSAPAPHVTAVDTNGAGDMFAGAFLHAINHQKSYVQAATFANKAAAKVVSQYGPRLRPEQYDALLATGQ